MTAAHQSDIFSASPRMEVGEAMDLTVQSLLAHATEHEHWAIAWSGGKDSTCTLTLVISLIAAGTVPRPKTLTVFYADTRMELPPLEARIRELIAAGTWPEKWTGEEPSADTYLDPVYSDGVVQPGMFA